MIKDPKARELFKQLGQEMLGEEITSFPTTTESRMDFLTSFQQ